VALAAQEINGLPVEPHDQPLDWVITEDAAVEMTR